MIIEFSSGTSRSRMAAAITSDPKGLPPKDPHALRNRANTLRDDGRYIEACALYEQLVAMAEAEHGPEHPNSRWPSH
jgi:hypothetical protein